MTRDDLLRLIASYSEKDLDAALHNVDKEKVKALFDGKQHVNCKFDDVSRLINNIY